jgi:hypothetical protein
MRKAAFIFVVIGILAASAAAQDVKTIETKLLSHFKDLEKYSNYVGTRDYDRLMKVNAALVKDVMRYGKLKTTLAYAFPKLKGKMFIVTSRDGKFRTYSWDTESGGTMHDFERVFQYRGKSGKVYTWHRPETDDAEFGGFVHDIFQTDTPAGPIYLPVSTFIGSTSLGSQSINTMKINGEKLDPDAKLIRTKSGFRNSVSFQYDFFSVVDHPERPVKLFKYDQAKQAFSFPVVIEDSKVPQGRVTGKNITYRFNGKYFERTN